MASVLENRALGLRIGVGENKNRSGRPPAKGPPRPTALTLQNRSFGKVSVFGGRASISRFGVRDLLGLRIPKVVIGTDGDGPPVPITAVINWALQPLRENPISGVVWKTVQLSNYLTLGQLDSWTVHFCLPSVRRS